MKTNYIALYIILLMIAIVTAKKEVNFEKAIKKGKNLNKKSNKYQTHI